MSSFGTLGEPQSFTGNEFQKFIESIKFELDELGKVYGGEFLSSCENQTVRFNMPIEINKIVNISRQVNYREFCDKTYIMYKAKPGAFRDSSVGYREGRYEAQKYESFYVSDSNFYIPSSWNEGYFMIDIKSLTFHNIKLSSIPFFDLHKDPELHNAILNDEVFIEPAMKKENGHSTLWLLPKPEPILEPEVVEKAAKPPKLSKPKTYSKHLKFHPSLSRLKK